MGILIDPYDGNGMWKSFTKTWHSKPYPQISPSRPELSAKGKTVFVTGGGTGIGKATAIAFAQAGAKAVAIFGRRVEKLESAAEEIRQANPQTLVVCESIDLTQFADVKRGFQNAIEKINGKVDVFIGNAAIQPRLADVVGYDEESLNEAIRGNLGSAFNAIQVIMPLLEEHASILNITSGIAHIDAMPRVWSYAVTKAATTKMFDYLQAENPKLRVFNVQPGVIATELNAPTGFAGQDEGKFGICSGCIRE